MADNVAQIVEFFRGKGLSDAQIAGVLGNLQVESGFNPSAYNAGEGAIGIAQWEGGRRTALQQYAAAHGGSETDLDMQLGYMWHELTTSESGAFNALRGATSAQQAATVWDEYYERSAGTTRQQRIGNAVSFFGSGLSDGGSGQSGNGGGAPSGMSASFRQLSSNGQGDFANELKNMGLGGLLDSIPELKQLVDQAVANDWTLSKFENEVEDSKWYKSHSATARSVLAQQANDPATYQANLTAAEQAIRKLSTRLGMPLIDANVENIAKQALLTGNAANDAWLTDHIAYYKNYSQYQGKNPLTGDIGATVAQLQSLASAYGLLPSDANLAMKAKDILTGNATLDAERAAFINTAKSIFPGLSDQLDAGQTVSDIADPYVQTMANLLEVDPSTLNVHTHLIRKALQGTPGDGKGSVPQVTPVWQFEQQVRQDPRWSYTDNAHQSMATMALQLGQMWGFS